MSIFHPTPDLGCPNSEVVAGLRKLATFLESHPELPRARFATVSLRAVTDGQPARETLELLATALGPDAIEDTVRGSDVEISGEFDAVTLKASASVRELADVPPEQLPYEPIIREANPVDFDCLAGTPLASGGDLMAALDRAIADRVAA